MLFDISVCHLKYWRVFVAAAHTDNGQIFKQAALIVLQKKRNDAIEKHKF